MWIPEGPHAVDSLVQPKSCLYSAGSKSHSKSLISGDLVHDYKICSNSVVTSGYAELIAGASTVSSNIC